MLKLFKKIVEKRKRKQEDREFIDKLRKEYPHLFFKVQTLEKDVAELQNNKPKELSKEEIEKIQQSSTEILEEYLFGAKGGK